MYVVMNIQDKNGSMLSCVSVMECDNYMYVAGVKVRLLAVYSVHNVCTYVWRTTPKNHMLHIHQ